eukprot:403333838
MKLYNGLNSEGISQSDVINIRQVFENLRDENDRPNEVKLSKLQLFPFFNKSDLSRFPRESERILNQMRDGGNGGEETYDPFTGRNVVNNQQDDYNNNQDSQQKNIAFSSNQEQNKVRMENKGIDCQSIMCGCSNPKQTNMQVKGIRERGITFDQFFEIMGEKMRDQKYHSNSQIVFENKESNVSCFLWPLFGQQQQ